MPKSREFQPVPFARYEDAQGCVYTAHWSVYGGWLASSSIAPNPAIYISVRDQHCGPEEPFGVLTVNIPRPWPGGEAGLRPWQFHARVSDVSASLAAAMLKSGTVEPVPDALPLQHGHLTVQVWQLRPEALTQQVREQIAGVMGWPSAMDCDEPAYLQEGEERANSADEGLAEGSTGPIRERH